MNREEIISFMKTAIVRATGGTVADISDDVELMAIGLSSIDAMRIMNLLRKKLDVDINPVVVFEYETLEKFATHLCDIQTERM